MTQPFVGQIQPFGFGFAPRYWAQCNGQTMSISQNQALFALLGTKYGGNGVNTFQLPNLQSRVPTHFGTSASGPYNLGQTGGEESVTLNINMLPLHNHSFLGSNANAAALSPAANTALAKSAIPTGTADPFYGSDAAPQPLNAASIAHVGGNAAHTNIQPYLAINFCIALYGIFPSRN